ncbi:MAG TPA: hypothetical protein VN645_15675 [Steroidobacteraceae bacterium]|nr:hypothetical protein [Steroidobacteraceae bacterium]
MDITEYWATFVSIILGLGVADLLVNLHRLIHERHRVRWDALPLLWALIALLWLFNYWWAVSANLDGSRDARVVGHLALLAVGPILLFLTCASVLPRALSADGVWNMSTEWASGRRVFFALFVGNQIFAWLVTLSVGAFTWNLAATTRSVALLIFVLLLFVRSRRVEWVAATVVFALLIARIATQPLH